MPIIGVRSLTEAIFTLPFVGKNFFRGIVINDDLPFGIDAAYQLLKATTFNWRRLLLCLGQRLFRVFNRLTNNENLDLVLTENPDCRFDWSTHVDPCRSGKTLRQP